VAFSWGVFDPLSTSVVTHKVIGKELIPAGKSGEVLLILTDQETFRDDLNIFVGKRVFFGDEMQIGHTYNMTVIGWGVPSIGWYRNIIQFKEVNP
jgi:hypothetical protein